MMRSGHRVVAVVIAAILTSISDRVPHVLVPYLGPAAAFAQIPAPMQAAPSDGAAGIAVGNFHACARMNGGGVKCWGANSFGQVGDGTRIDRSVPVSVTGLTTGVVAIAAGDAHTCVITGEGGVKCWGHNDAGQLGNDSTGDSLTPVDVVGLSSGVTFIAASYEYTCAVTRDGGVKCWGRDDFGQLGDGRSNEFSNKPVDVVGLTSGVVEVATSNENACALTSAGGVKCWGRGDGVRNPFGGVSKAIDVVGLASGVTAISAGALHVCARTRAGSIKCWGSNGDGALGIDSVTKFSMTPVDVTGLSGGVMAIAVGSLHTCVLTSAGSVKCWGTNSDGQLGNGSTTNSSRPVDVTGLTSGVVAIANGGISCALRNDGTVSCWGINVSGALGNGSATTNSAIPIDVKLNAGLTATAVQPPAGRGNATAQPTAEPRTSFRNSVPTPAEITFNPKIVAQSLAIAAGIVLLVPFPGILFNSTLEANYAEVAGRVRRARHSVKRGVQSLFKLLWMKLRHGLQRSSTSSTASPSPSNAARASIAEKVDSDHEQLSEGRFWKTPLGVIVFLLLSALMFALLDPTFGPNRESLSTFEGITAGLVVTLLAFCVPIALAYRRNAISFSMKALPGTLAIGLACVLISRLTHFQPGYLYGLIVTFAVAEELSFALEGRATAIATTTALVVAVVAWFGDWWVVSLTSAQTNPAPKLIILQTALVMVMVAGIELTALGMLPLRFLPGEKVYRWNRRYWAALFGIGIVGFVHVLLNPKNGYLSDSARTPLTTIVSLLVLFGLGSVVFWAYFRFRRIRVSPSVAS